MERLERLGREAKYDGMVKPPCASAMAAGKRRPAYINYTPEGRKKSRAAAVPAERKMNMGAWVEIEEKCEGKTVLVLSANSIGMIIRFTDGTCLRYINGILQLEEKKQSQ